MIAPTITDRIEVGVCVSTGSLRRCLTRMPSRSTAQRQHQNSENRPKNNTHEDHDASNLISLSSKLYRLIGISEACR